MTVYALIRYYDDDGNETQEIVDLFEDEGLASERLEELCPDGDDYEYEIVEREVVTKYTPRD